MKKQKLLYFALFFVLSAAILIFSPLTEDRPEGVKDVTVEEAKKMIERKDTFVLDVRTPSEFSSSHIEGATLLPVTNAFGSNLSPDTLLEARINEVPKNKKILVYCRSGQRSTSASTMLANAGYSEVYNMEGGINSWIDARYPVESSEDLETEEP